MLTLPEVEKIAHLARLHLTEAEKQQFQQQLSAVLDYMAVLEQLDTRDVPPTAHAVPQQNIWREDYIEPSLTTEDVFFNTSQHEQQQFKIQSVLLDE
ncbi:MAG: Asp-tRNA(Asn)/Glu-tRNA(Gln) amidotransferase subunit GatC [Anaerolineae bacterium]|nr:Asp-tRNA(Asn)/Glu-tRNA(Gln) amidotransferase subunit GatC [Anaerolineae bacterium]